MLNDLFQNLGFSDKESEIYIILLKSGTATAGDISRKTNINRTTVYDILENLMQKGLVSKYKKGGKTFFNTFEPKHLLTYLDREKEEYAKRIEKQKEKTQQLLPQIISLQNLKNAKPKVQFFEGEKGMREAYEDTLDSKEIILAYANVETMHKGLPNFFPEYYARRAKNKVFIRAILPQNTLSIERSKYNQEEMRRTKFLPSQDMTFSPEVNIYDNKMLIASWEEKMAVIIESKELADLQKIIFNLLWDSLPNNK
ncbi:hypothetical protein A2477_03365 [Candidatus Falkowbacteria bacterium RIFOXYC2_FULL_47_12]|uniref:Transcription regulator TrmB N-terminal domain-containing protein n=2 Tax=Candidatus Falkowiibacteriota TaxID=1752728 RepID=A0A1F5TP23_9BACT|nr:MAG: hypothetical protein A2242_04155 [Candidatus Falkowbacteria bacterium RIFOXYA2_FULL_47_9]OGF40554.1 MAG: hypothetical protein A2477_03365 [Candidatus Falkowbacteria bacterium RIFOXYC2_FULL_47_12]